jgi:dihydrofolate synthase/folylpolyglutamate synthase
MRTAKPCICSDQNPPSSLLAYAKKIDTSLTLVKEQYKGEIGLEGAHQRLNAAVAIKVIEAISDQFPVSKEMIKGGIKQVQIVARFEKINVGNKTVILDVAHNPAAVQTLINTLSDSPIETVAIFSALADKNIDDMIELASSNIKHWFLVPLSAERSIQIEALEDKFGDSQETTVCASMASAIEQALALKEIQRVVIFGSFYTVADASVILKKSEYY